VGAGVLVLQPDGKLVVAGDGSAAQGEFVLARYNADGTLDPNFGQSGIVTIAIPGDGAYSLVRQPDGKLVAAGDYIPTLGNGDFEFALARSETDGVLDPGFGSRGTVKTEFKLYCLVPNVTGKMLAAALRRIRQAYCSLARMTKVRSATVETHRVISQQPAPGKKLRFRSKIKLTVSTGTPP
jgi:uncharacterized delta-60 repeat protein